MIFSSLLIPVSSNTCLFCVFFIIKIKNKKKHSFVDGIFVDGMFVVGIFVDGIFVVGMSSTI